MAVMIFPMHRRDDANGCRRRHSYVKVLYIHSISTIKDGRVVSKDSGQSPHLAHTHHRTKICVGRGPVWEN